VQARKYVRAVMSDLPTRNGWSVAEWAGDLLPGMICPELSGQLICG
jgi:hypothetical protein